MNQDLTAKNVLSESTKSMSYTFKHTFCISYVTDYFKNQCPNCDGSVIQPPVRFSTLLSKCLASTQQVNLQVLHAPIILKLRSCIRFQKRVAGKQNSDPNQKKKSKSIKSHSSAIAIDHQTSENNGYAKP